jgi:hypothetical protein
MKEVQIMPTDINGKAKKCPNCHADQQNWFSRHNILTGIGALILLAGLGSAMSGTPERSDRSALIRAAG